MNSLIQSYFVNLDSSEAETRFQALNHLLTATEVKVDWAYEVWNELKDDLTHLDNHRRSIAVQLLCNLSKSDPEERIIQDFSAVYAVTKDKRFVTARHSLQSIWKIGTRGVKQLEMVIGSLEDRYRNCLGEKNYTLIRYDIIQDFKHLYHELKDETIQEKALELIAIEEDMKYRKKYTTLWKKV